MTDKQIEELNILIDTTFPDEAKLNLSAVTRRVVPLIDRWLAERETALIEECAKFAEEFGRKYGGAMYLAGNMRREIKPAAQQALERYVAERTKELSEPISCGHRKANLVETEESKAMCEFDSTMQPVVVCSACERTKELRELGPCGVHPKACWTENSFVCTHCQNAGYATECKTEPPCCPRCGYQVSILNARCSACERERPLVEALRYISILPVSSADGPRLKAAVEKAEQALAAARGGGEG